MKRVLATGLLGLLIETFPASPLYASIAYPQQPYSVTVDQAGFRIDGEYQLLRGGSLQYWRLPQSVWRDRLKRFKAAGFNTVDMYVPWNVVEPVEGQFNFDEPNLRYFLELCKELELFVYFRPGPYITNEMDGGGVPAWLMAKSTKQTIAADGKPNLRTQDPDYLAAVQRYFHALNQAIKPYLASQGGPIVLYSIENEYNWFEIFLQVDKLAWYEGAMERFTKTPPITSAYLTALRDMVQADGIDVPITTCPGDGKLSGMGRVPGVIPMPNMYSGLGGGQPEKTVNSLLQKMHDPALHGGIYNDFPSGTTETDRIPAKIKRLLMAGLDATFAFNIFGSHQEGYRNGVALNIDTVKSIVDRNDKRPLSEKIANVQVGYYHNVVDFNGAVSPSGGHRESYYEFRRDNAFFDTVTPYLAPRARAYRTAVGMPGSDTRLAIAQSQLGTRESGFRVHYWMQHQGTSLISLVNETTTDQIVPVGAITLEGESLPKHVPMTVPLQEFDGKPQFGTPDLSYAQVLVHNLPLPLPDRGRLHYTTSELMWARDFNGETLILVHGKSGTQGELVLDQLVSPRVIWRDAGVNVPALNTEGLAVTYTHDGFRQLLLEDAHGERYRVVITDSKRAGRTWQVGQGDTQVLISGADYIDSDSVIAGSAGLDFVVDHASASRPLHVVSAQPFTLQGADVLQAYQADTGTAVYQMGERPALPALPDIRSGAVQQLDVAEALPGFDDRWWQQWSGEARPLERLGIYTGHAWYRSTFTLNSVPSTDTGLYIQGASDFVGVYVNGHYVSTVAPMGTAIDSRSSSQRYRFASLTPYLKTGENVIAFRSEIWGHGSFMFPRGKLFLFGPSIPAVGFDSLKGLTGKARVGRTALSQWRVRAGLGGENAAFMGESLEESGWDAVNAGSEGAPFLSLQKGDVRWVRSRFETADIPSPQNVQAPVVLALEGQRSKATVYLNGKLIGRWISDNKVLGQGFWASGAREMWMNTDPNHFPIAYEDLRQDGRPNVLAIAFEDTSHSSDAAGVVSAMRLQYAVENRRYDAQGVMQREAATRWRQPVRLEWQ